MYKGRSDLEQLIATLKKGEKKHFNLLYKDQLMQKEVPLFLQLYTVLENGKSQLEFEQIKTTDRSITSAKRRLYENILKSLRAINEESSIDTCIQNLLNNVDLLYLHSLPEQSFIQLHKAYELSKQHEKFGLLLQVLEWEKKLNIVSNSPLRTLQEIMVEERETLNRLSQQMDLESLYGDIMLLKKQHGYVKGNMIEVLKAKILQSAILPSEQHCLSNKAKYYRNYILAIYYWMIFDHKTSFNYSKKLILTNQNTILAKDYINGIFQHITSSTCLGHFTETLNGIQLGAAYLEEHKLSSSQAFRGMMFAYQATYRTIVYNYTGDTAKLSDCINYIEQKLPEFEHSLPVDFKQIIMGNLMNAYLGIGAMDKAFGIWDKLFNRHSQQVRKDIYTDLFLFRLFYLIHTKSYELLESASNSALRYFRKSENTKDQFTVEMPIALLLNKEYDWENKKIRTDVLSGIKKIVSEFIESLNGAVHFQEHYTRYIIWSDALIIEEPYHKSAKKWHTKFMKQNRP